MLCPLVPLPWVEALDSCAICPRQWLLLFQPWLAQWQGEGTAWRVQPSWHFIISGKPLTLCKVQTLCKVCMLYFAREVKSHSIKDGH